MPYVQRLATGPAVCRLYPDLTDLTTVTISLVTVCHHVHADNHAGKVPPGSVGKGLPLLRSVDTCKPNSVLPLA